ncbi:GTPase [Streptomyces beigongshangae]|uniref:GTPase n=1 Tax=Streptomyces beigongshangae TaxID=2841597 RepID=UPI001C85E250|nr:GTPase [Streptomyces sp. REN17]
MSADAHGHDNEAFDVAAVFQEGLAQADQEEAMLNVMLAGRPGAGKSTLVNAIFGERIAPVGTGAPVTQKINAYRRPHLPVTVYDTPGYELGKSPKEVAGYFLSQIRKEVTTQGSEIHFALYCSLIANKRVEQFEADLVRALAGEVHTAFVLTQCLDKESQEVIDLRAHLDSRKLPIVENRPFPVLAEEKLLTFSGQSILVKQFGLEDLLRALTRVLPAAQKRTLVSRQRVNLELKVKEANAIVAETALKASAIAAVPIPLYDIGPLSALQVAMFARITRVMGFSIEPKSLAAACTAVIGVGTAARTASSLLKLALPLVGSVVNATVAGSTTYAMGTAYVKACEGLLRLQIAGVPIDQDDIIGALVREWKKAR